MKSTLPLVFGAILLLPSLAPAQTLVRSISGTANQLYGSCMIRVGDQNGDGFEDVIVGAPGVNSGNGAIFCVSGLYLALGVGAVHLWSVTPTLGPGAQFGASIAIAGNLTGDSAIDFVVGAPGAANGFGGVALVDGGAHTAVSFKPSGGALGAGSAVANVGDRDGDGKPDIAVGIPSGFYGVVVVVSGVGMSNNTSIAASAIPSLNRSGPSSFGSTLAAADFNGDGKLDLVAGAPQAQVGPTLGVGAIFLIDYESGFPDVMFPGSIAGEHFGAALEAAHDYDGDGVIDVVVGAPDYAVSANQFGRAVVLSGGKLIAAQSPTELYAVSGGGGATHGSGWRCGAAVCASPDLNGDGVGDILVGLPGFDAGLPAKGGSVRVLSGKTGAVLCTVNGAANQRLGGALLGACSDLDGDGFPEFIAAGPKSSAAATDAGVIKIYRLFPAPAGTYCTAKVNSLGCAPSIGFSGGASASSTSPFNVACSNVINNKSGLLVYSHQLSATAFQGGLLCVKPPTKRVGAQNSGGSSGAPNCSGTFSFDFNARIRSGVDATLQVGRQIFCQYWSRDPQASFGSSLSNGVHFVINP
jgi:hypothetical protein